MDENEKTNIKMDIGNLYYLIYKKNKKINSRLIVKKFLIYIKIYTILKIIYRDNSEWEFHENPKLFINSYIDDEKFFKQNIMAIFYKTNLPDSVKMELPIDKTTVKGLKTYNYLVKNKKRITSSENNYLECQDYIRLFQALSEDIEELKIDIYNLRKEIDDKVKFLNDHDNIPNLKKISSNEFFKNIKPNLKKNIGNSKELKHVHFCLEK